MQIQKIFSRRGGGGVTFRPGWVQLHASGVIINLSKWVDHGTDSHFWYIQRPEQDLMILINLSPQIHGLLLLYFPLSGEKNDGWAGNCFGSVRSSFVTLLSALCVFTGIELGIPCCTSLLTYKYCVCLSVCRFCTFWKTLLYEREKLY